LGKLEDASMAFCGMKARDTSNRMRITGISMKRGGGGGKGGRINGRTSNTIANTTIAAITILPSPKFPMSLSLSLFLFLFSSH
jgi:hypothetical protein